MRPIVLATTEEKISERERKNAALARRIAAEGFVMLENKGMLPLKDKKVALYGSGARQTVAGGTGSGATHSRHTVGIEEGLVNAGFKIVSKSWLDKYDSYYDETYRTWKAGIEEKVAGFYDLGKILGVVFANKFLYPTGIPVESEDISSETENAIYVIARQAGEGVDRKDIEGDYRIDETELKNLETVCKNYKNVCVVINVGGFVDLSFMDKLNVNALIYYSQGGMSGGDAFADLVSGKISPSGKLSASWAYNLSDFPSTGGYSYLGDTLNQNYSEGIYVGYRYFDSFGVTPRYRFGYGLSYTTFKISAECALKGDKLNLSATVKNTGACGGKEVVQAYVTVPQNSGAEYQRLVAFVKTDEISAGKEERVQLEIPVKELASYCEKCNSWVLGAGEYIIRIGNSSGNTEPVAVMEVKEDIVTEKCTSICPVKGEIKEIAAPRRKEEALTGVKRLVLQPSAVRTVVNEYPELPVSTDRKISAYLDKFDNGDLAALLIGGGTHSDRLVNVMGASGTTGMRLYEKYGIPNAILSDGPAGLNVTPRVVELPDGTLKSADTYPQYDFGMFGKMLRKKMVANPGDGVCHYQYATAWPCGVVCAQTWNTGLLNEMGDAVGAEMDELGVTVWLAPGMNIIRNTLCGRTFEYYSEDPVLSGEIAAALVNGVQKHKGKGVSIKHFACNNCENDRHISSSNINERALREIYLKGFEIAVKKSKPVTVMASYNKINGVYNTNNRDLLLKVLRNEWGFEGLVMSDWEAVREGRGDVTAAHFAQCDLIMPGEENQVEELKNALDCGKVNRDDALRSAERVLKIIIGNTVSKFGVE